MFENIIWPVVSLGGMGLLFGAGLAFASKKFSVEKDPREDEIKDVLPGANCGACGYPGCDGLAAAIVAGEAAVNSCPVGGKAVAEKVSSIMGVDANDSAPMVAKVLCKGGCSETKNKFNYQGIYDCEAASMLLDGPKSCSYGCLGMGTCVKACPFDAIYINDNGIAEVDQDKCTACGICVQACPKNVVELVPIDKKVHVMCNSMDKGKAVKQNCEVGCIGCGICAKVCRFDAIELENNLAKINYDKCTNCSLCAKKCPTKAIASQIVTNNNVN